MQEEQIQIFSNMFRLSIARNKLKKNHNLFAVNMQILNMQILNGCKIVVLVGCCERFFQTKPFGGNDRILSLYERNTPLFLQITI